MHEELKLLKALYRFRFAALAVAILIAAAAVLFAARKEERVASTAALCIAQTEQAPAGFCADFDHPAFDLFGLGDLQRFAASMAAAYFSQGYYGLSLAL